MRECILSVLIVAGIMAGGLGVINALGPIESCEHVTRTHHDAAGNETARLEWTECRSKGKKK
jgi:hypothetical protein